MDVITFETTRIRIPSTRVVKIPYRYAHEFASMPTSWREVTVPEPSRFLEYPHLDPAHTPTYPWLAKEIR